MCAAPSSSALCGKMSNTQRGNLAIVFIPHLLLDGPVVTAACLAHIQMESFAKKLAANGGGVTK